MGHSLVLLGLLLFACFPSCLLAAFTNCGLTADLNYAPWTNLFETDLPTLFPQSEQELSAIIAKARQNNCRVRPVGATHTVSGTVAQKTETNVVTVNLADVVPDNWNFKLDEARGIVRAPAGASLFDLQAFIRPKGYLLPTSTASPLFALGGVFLTPSVHGAFIEEDRVTTLLMGVRAMLSDGAITEEFGEEDMRKWRGSLGFLGIVTGVEVRVRKDTGLLYVPDKFRITPWNRQRHTELLTASLRGVDSAQYFWNPLEDDVVGNRIDSDGDPSFDFKATTAFFNEQREEFAGIQRKSRRSPQQTAVDIAVGTGAVPNRKAIKAALKVVENMNNNRNESPRDNYSYSTSATFNNQIECHFACKQDCISDGTLFALMDVTRTYIRRIAESDRRFPYIPVTWRFLTVASDDVFILNYLPAGRYIGMEVTVPRDANKRDEPFSPYLRDLEGIWNNLSMQRNGRPLVYHIQKEYGHANIPGLPQPYPFRSDATANAFFTPAQRSRFLTVANQYDPDGVFRAGELARLLGVSDVKFEPRRGNQEESQGASTGCKTFRNPECLSSCCCRSVFFCFDGFNKCTVSGLPRGRTCKTGCSCSSGRCLFGRCF